MSKSQREKGKVGERQAAELLRALYPTARRTISQARSAEACDVEGTPWWVEVKCGAKPRPIAALEQADRDATAADDERPALVLVRTDRRGWTVTLAWSDFARLASQGQRAREVALAMATGAGESS